MKQKIYIFFAITILSVFMTIPSEAGYYMKKKAPATTAVAVPDQPATTSATEASSSATKSSSPVLSGEKSVVKKKGFFSRLFHTIARHKAEISQALYIVLSIFWLGWLAMGINDDFQGYEWVLCLVLYCLFWLPGFIYSLIKMGDYY
jgi:hypothetical protein